MKPKNAVVTFSSTAGLFEVKLCSKVVEEIITQCQFALPRETGGILVGNYSPDQRIAYITDTISPEGNSHAGRSWFERGVRGVAEALGRFWRRQARKYYLGEWHSHPQGEPTPSHQDVSSMFGIASCEAEKCPEPVLLIVAGKCAAPSDMGVYVFTRAGRIEPLIGSPD